MIAVVLDSLSLTNYEMLWGKMIPFAQLVGAMTFITLDFPQLVIHLCFLFAYHIEEIPHAEATVIMSLIFTVLSFLISLFNMLASKPNGFDPILLQLELKKRRL